MHGSPPAAVSPRFVVVSELPCWARSAAPAPVGYDQGPERTLLEQLFERGLQTVGHEGDEDVRFDALVVLMMDRADRQIPFERLPALIPGLPSLYLHTPPRKEIARGLRLSCPRPPIQRTRHKICLTRR